MQLTTPDSKLLQKCLEALDETVLLLNTNENTTEDVYQVLERLYEDYSKCVLEMQANSTALDSIANEIRDGNMDDEYKEHDLTALYQEKLGEQQLTNGESYKDHPIYKRYGELRRSKTMTAEEQ